MSKKKLPCSLIDELIIDDRGNFQLWCFLWKNWSECAVSEIRRGLLESESIIHCKVHRAVRDVKHGNLEYCSWDFLNHIPEEHLQGRNVVLAPV